MKSGSGAKEMNFSFSYLIGSQAVGGIGDCVGWRLQSFVGYLGRPLVFVRNSEMGESLKVLKAGWQLARQLVYSMLITNNYALFRLW